MQEKNKSNEIERIIIGALFVCIINLGQLPRPKNVSSDACKRQRITNFQVAPLFIFFFLDSVISRAALSLCTLIKSW